MGNPVRPDELLYQPSCSLIMQAKASRLYEQGVNGDGLGLGWYGSRPTPGVYRNPAPAWGDRNFRELCAQLEAPMFLAHVRAATGTDVQQTNCHPFRFDKWLFVHNGFLADYQRVRRELLVAVSSELFTNISGSTDSELLFHLALTFGLEKEPIAALERMAGFVERVGARHGVAEPLQMTVGLSDGKSLYAVRYASGAVVNSLYVSENIDALRELYPDSDRAKHFQSGARAIVSEPLGDLPGVWKEVPVATALIVRDGKVDTLPFQPRPPAQA